MKIFRSGSSIVVAECQVFFKFLPITYQIDHLRMLSICNSLLHLKTVIGCVFRLHTLNRLNDVYLKYGNYVTFISSLRHAVESMFFKR
jgi:hypothetical protein